MISSWCLAGPEPTVVTDRVYRYEETMPVKGMVVIRAVRSATDGQMQPVEFNREKRGWVVVAKSFEAYREAMAAKNRELEEAKAAQAKTNALKSLEKLPSRPLNEQIGFIAQRLTPEQRARFQAELARQANEPREVCPPSG
jgi:hypothetical protein